MIMVVSIWYWGGWQSWFWEWFWVLTAWSCSISASGDCIALDQLDRVFSGFSIFDWAAFNQLDLVVSGLSPLLVWDLPDQASWVLSGLPFIWILSDQAGRVLSGLSRLNWAFLSGLAITLLVFLSLLNPFWNIAFSLIAPARPWPWPEVDSFQPIFVLSSSLWPSAYTCP